MRLLFVIDSLCSGGAQRQLTSLAVALKRRGHDIEFFVYHDIDHFGPELRAAGIEVRLQQKPWRFSVAPVRALRRLYRDGGYDLVLSFLTVPNAYCALAGIGLANRPKVVLSERLMRQENVSAGIRFCERTYPWADHITTNSYHMREYFRQRHGWGDDRVSVIWNGLDLDRFSVTPCLRRPGDPLRLLCVGRMNPVKNWHVVAMAAARLMSDGIDVSIDHVGCTHRLLPADANYFAELKALCVQLGLKEAWTFHGEQSSVEPFYAASHLLVHPSLVEGLPNVICESLACGRPVAAGDAFDNRRLIQDGQSGWLFDAHSVDSLVDVLRKANALSTDELAEMGGYARRFAEQQLSIQRLADEYEHLFRRLLGGGEAKLSDVSANARGGRDDLAVVHRDA